MGGAVFMAMLVAAAVAFVVIGEYAVAAVAASGALATFIWWRDEG